MAGNFGLGRIRQTDNGNSEVFVQMTKKQTMIIETYPGAVGIQPFRYFSEDGQSIDLKGKWKITFQSGGPELPDVIELDTLSSWTNFGSDYGAFSGTASYTTRFKRPAGSATEWLLDLGNVKETARIFLNGIPLASLIGPSYQCYLDSSVLKEENVLEIRVSNLMANRIADIDRAGVFWKKFYNINFPARKPENRKNGLFDASQWKPRESGLIGPVRLIPIKSI
jgi:hypothetical protein